MKRTLMALALLAFTMPLAAQWLGVPTPGIPRTADGSPDLSAPTPRTADGHPDLTGLWRAREVTGDLNDDSKVQPWARDTMSLCFSTSKGVAATAIHILATDGLLDYDAPVARYWPEFGQKGKEAITVRQVLAHQAGLHQPLRSAPWNSAVSAAAPSTMAASITCPRPELPRSTRAHATPNAISMPPPP